MINRRYCHKARFLFWADSFWGKPQEHNAPQFHISTSETRIKFQKNLIITFQSPELHVYAGYRKKRGRLGLCPAASANESEQLDVILINSAECFSTNTLSSEQKKKMWIN